MKKWASLLLMSSLLPLSSCHETPVVFRQSSIAGYESFSEVVASLDANKETVVISFGDAFSSQEAKLGAMETREKNEDVKDSLGAKHTYTDRYLYFPVNLAEEDKKSLFPLIEEKIPEKIELRILFGILLCERSLYYDGKLRTTVTQPVKYYLCADLGGGHYYNGNSSRDFEPSN